jgi:hypothetical protein
MNINSDGVEIEDVCEMEVYGEWIKFTDSEGAVVKISPGVVRRLMAFALEHMTHFEEGAWE